MKQKLVEAIKKWNKQTSSNIHKFIFVEQLKEKHKVKIEQGFGQGIPIEEWVAIQDSTLTQNGKKGALFTKDHLYLSGESTPIPLIEVEKAYKVGHRDVIIKWKNATLDLIETPTSGDDIASILQNLVGMTQAKAYSDAGYEVLHTTYRRELRRRMNALTKKKCEEDENLHFMETVSEEYIQNALLRCEEVDRSKIVGFFKTTKSNGKEAIIITEEAIYSGTGEKVRIPFDGLKQIYRKDNLFTYYIYENNYVQKTHFYAGNNSFFWDLINEYIKIYHALCEEIMQGNVVKTGLELVDGLEKFLTSRDESIIDSYRNAVFVSSTFRDMHFERDIIHERVQPALNALADRYGEYISFCDLRWGVNTENLDSEEGAKKVLVVCLDEIERCKPCMLIMLGERYGWIPKEQTIINALETRRDFVLDELEKSVTALEIEFGALKEKTELDRVFVYFREMGQVPSDEYLCEDKYHAKKLAKLKMRVQKQLPNRVKTYQLTWDNTEQKMIGLDTFAEMVISDIGNIMEAEWKKNVKKSAFEQEVQQHVRYMKHKAALCYARNEILQKCLVQIEDGAHLLAITGVSGCGKSTLMSGLASILKTSEAKVLPIFCGLTARTESALGLMKHMVYYLEELLDKAHIEDEKKDVSEEIWRNTLKNLVQEYSETQNTPLFILIDAIDQLMPDDIRNNLKFIPENIEELNSKVYLCISCLEEFQVEGISVKYTIPMLENKNKLEVVNGILKHSRRELDENVSAKIIQKNASNSPLYLTLLIQRLLMMNKNDFAEIMADGDGMSAITKHQMEIVENCGETISDICKEMIAVAAERIGGELVKLAISYIAITQHGLRKSDLEGLLKAKNVNWNQLEFSLFINYLRNVFVLREDGCYDFSHKIIRQELRVEEHLKQELHRDIVLWLETLPKNDMLRKREFLLQSMTARMTESFVNHIVACEETDYEELNKIFVAVCRSDDGNSFIQMINELMDFEFTEEILSGFFKYIIGHAMRTFTSTDEDLRIRENIYQELMVLTKEVANKYSGFEHERRVSVIHARLGKVYELRKDEKAEIYYKKSLEISKGILEKYKNEQSQVDVAIDYRVLAGLYMKFEDSSYNDQIHMLLMKSIELAEYAATTYHSAYAKRCLGWSYKRIGDFYEHCEDRENALHYYYKCKETRGDLLKGEHSNSDMLQYAYILEILGNQFCEVDWDKAAAFYDERITHMEKVVQEERTASNVETLGWSYHDAGYAHFSIGTLEHKQRALECYEKSNPIFEEILKRAERMYMLWVTAEDYSNCMDVLNEMDGVDNKLKLKKYALRSIALYEERANKLNTPQAYDTLDAVYASYAKYAGDTVVEERCLKNRIALKEKVYEMTHDKVYKKEIAALKLSLSIISGIVKKL